MCGWRRTSFLGRPAGPVAEWERCGKLAVGSGFWPATEGLNVDRVGVVEPSNSLAECECGAVLGRGVAVDGVMTSSVARADSFTGRKAAAMTTGEQRGETMVQRR